MREKGTATVITHSSTHLGSIVVKFCNAVEADGAPLVKHASAESAVVLAVSDALRLYID